MLDACLVLCVCTEKSHLMHNCPYDEGLMARYNVNPFGQTHDNRKLVTAALREEKVTTLSFFADIANPTPG